MGLLKDPMSRVPKCWNLWWRPTQVGRGVPVVALTFDVSSVIVLDSFQMNIVNQLDKLVSRNMNGDLKWGSRGIFLCSES